MMARWFLPAPNRMIFSLLRLFATLLAMLFLVVPLAIAQRSDTRTPENVPDLIKLSRKLERAESLSEAEKTLRRAMEIDPTNAEAKIELAYILTKQRHLLDAYNIVFPIAQADNKNAHALAVLGIILLDAGRFSEAEIFLTGALKLNRSQDLAWSGLGLLQFYENNVDASIESLEEAVFESPKEPDYWFALAQVTARAEKYKDASEAYRRFLEVSGSSDVERRTRILGLIEFLKYIGQKSSLYDSVGKKSTTVPFDLVSNRPIIKVSVNKDAEPLRFVLDTGSGITVISEETAKRLNIKPISHGGFAKGLGGNGRFEIVYGFLRSLQIGDVSVQDVPVYIRKFQSDPGQEVDGYIGLALISKFLATIDYGTDTFSLLKRDDENVPSDEALHSLPLRLTSSGFLSGEVELEGMPTPLNFIVDTGASVSVISDGVASTQSMSRYANDEKLRVVGSAGITDNVPTFMLPKVTFGPHSRTSIVAIALDLGIINEASGFEQAGILGGNFLKNYRLTFDFKNSKVIFTSVVPEK